MSYYLFIFLSITSIALFVQGQQNLNWKNAKRAHFRNNPPLVNRNNDDLDYFANGLGNERHFRAILDEIIIPRPVGSRGHQKVQRFIANFMRELNWEVQEHQFNDDTPLGEKTFTNIIATLNPSAPRRLVLACHYDSKITPRGFVGATDSAVPCSQMLNLAYTMQLNLRDHAIENDELTLQFMFLDGEEAFKTWTSRDSIYGARKLAGALANENYSHNGIRGKSLDRIDAFVLLDLIGEKDPTFMRLKSTTADWFSTLVDIERRLSHIRAFNSAHKREMFVDIQGPAGIQDDHLPFEQRGVPILHLITYPFPKTWHKITDDKAHLDFPTISNLNKIFRVFVAEYLGLK